jgi:hypothetical protein
MQRLKATVEPVASGSCDHRHREDGYRPSRALGDLVRARTATCPAPGCGASSAYSDVDHTRAWPAGDTDECNLGPDEGAITTQVVQEVPSVLVLRCVSSNGRCGR